MSTIIIRDTNDKNCREINVLNETVNVIIFNSGINEFSNRIHASVFKDSTLNIYNVTTTSFNNNIELNVDLVEKHSTCNVINVILNTSNSESMSMIKIDHLKPNTTSVLSTYAISKDNSCITLDNNAFIKKGCVASVVMQKAKGLTLSKESKIIAKPNLYIDEYDVIANHAASIGSINKDDLFYLMSRGLSSSEASKLIVMGFIKPLLDKIEDESLKSEIETSFKKYL